MGEKRWGMEGDFRMKARSFWGFRAWKRHDLILSVAGVMYTLIGFAYIVAEPNPSRSISLQILVRLAPLDFWGGVFILAGVLSIISSRWPPASETWGYTVLTGISMGWGSTYLMGILFGDSPWTNINGFFIWGLLGFLWWAVSGLVNPDKIVVVNGDRPN